MRSPNENEVILTNPQGDNCRKINGSDRLFAIMQGCVFAHSSVIIFYVRAIISRMVDLKMNEKRKKKKSKQTMR